MKKVVLSLPLMMLWPLALPAQLMPPNSAGVAMGQVGTIVRDVDAARRQFVLQPMQRQMRRLPDPLLDEGSMRLQQSLAMAAHPVGLYRSRRPITL